MHFTKTDLSRCEGLLKALKRAKFDLEGEEVLAMGQTIVWASQLYSKMKEELDSPPLSVTDPEPIKAPPPVKEKKK